MTNDEATVPAGEVGTEARPGKPPIVDLAAWQAAREELLTREKAQTRACDAMAAARRRMPMLELDGAATVTGAKGPVPFLDVFEGRRELVVYKSMWYDGAPHQGQCEGCTQNAWNMKDTAPYLNARGVTLAFQSPGAWDELAPFVEFTGTRCGERMGWSAKTQDPSARVTSPASCATPTGCS